jgi:hypothetical protein
MPRVRGSFSHVAHAANTTARTDILIRRFIAPSPKRKAYKTSPRNFVIFVNFIAFLLSLSQIVLPGKTFHSFENI